MYKKLLLLLAVVAVAVPALVGFQGSDAVTRKQLREMLVQLGYEVKDLETAPGKEKYSYTQERSGLNIPIGAEISPSNSYIWLTVNCKGEVPTGDKAVELLKKNAEIQPSFFYVTKSGKLLMALPIDNRGVTNALLRQRSEKLVDDVAKTKDVWQ